MAGFTKTHGDFQPLMNYDAFLYETGLLNAYTSAATVQPQGPKLEYATVTFTGTGTTGAQVAAAIQTIQQLATVYIYEFTTVGAGDDTLAFAFYPVGAWGDVTAVAAGSLDALLTTACGEAVAITATATFTN